MAKIKDWNIISNTAEIFVSEKGDLYLLRDNNGDVASFRVASDNIVINSERNVSVVINETKKEIIINRK